MDYIMQEMPDIHGTGEKKYYPKVDQRLRIPHNTIVRLFMDMTNMSRISIEGVMSELPNVLNAYLQTGHSVKIEGFGTFSLILGLLSEKEMEDRGKVGANQSGVYIKKINFLPDREWLNGLRASTELNLVKGLKQKYQEPSTLEERRQIALAAMESKGYLQVRDYMVRTGLGRSKATRELNGFCDDPESGIKSEGSGSHKVYVKA